MILAPTSAIRTAHAQPSKITQSTRRPCRYREGICDRPQGSFAGKKKLNADPIHCTNRNVEKRDTFLSVQPCLLLWSLGLCHVVVTILLHSGFIPSLLTPSFFSHVIPLQRVSAGWTQDDLPPKEVDDLLRDVEDIYSVNRKFSKKLVDVLAASDVTKELGSVLMWFVDSMETPYSNFCRSHVPRLDNWPEIMNNTRLQDILAVKKKKNH